MMKRLSPRIVLAAALLLPIIVLAASWAITHRRAQQGQEWLVPISGYDPRDLLRGHYVQYRYDWPIAATSAEEQSEAVSFGDALCIEGVAPRIKRVRRVTPILGSVDAEESKGCAIVARATFGARREVQGLDTGIFYASQEQALGLSRRLADPALQGFVRVRIREDGVMRPVALEFSRR